MILLVTFGEIFSLPFMNTYWTERSQEGNRGQYAAMYAMSWSAAQTIGPVLGAQLADAAGFAVLWWTVGGICILAALLFRNLKR
jgi:MFS family permease